FFSADQPAHGLWRSDGTPAGTILVKLVGGSSPPESLTPVSGTLYFVLCQLNSVGYALWKSDGTTAGTVMVKDLDPSISCHAKPSGLADVNGMLYFAADDGVHGLELWKSDGTPAGTVLVSDTWPGPGGGSAAPWSFGSLAFFSGRDVGVSSWQLWVTNGTSA